MLVLMVAEFEDRFDERTHADDVPMRVFRADHSGQSPRDGRS
jgi:hypothetical protein